MRILIIGSGGREHALSWAISDSPLVEALFITPGSPGTDRLAEAVALDIADHAQIISFCSDQQIDLVVIGPEAPLVDGLVDSLDAANIASFGPSAAAAQLEGSKEFARDFNQRHAIPQPRWQSFDNAEDAVEFARALGGASVIKADGLAAGKGVIVCDDLAQAEQAIRSLLGGRFAEASARIVVEERLHGIEMSAFALLDGKTAIWLASAQDHKRAFDNDEGENTGGMGAISPSPLETDTLISQIMTSVIMPVCEGMKAENMPYKGVLYVGLMLTDDGPKVIEYNCRFGDPEAQVIIPRMMTDLVSAMMTLYESGLGHFNLRLSTSTAITVVMASKGYPGAYEKGSRISNIGLAEQTGCIVFHAGTAQDDTGQLMASGGRVLAVTAIDENPKIARQTAYQGVAAIDWAEGFYRTDIAAKALGLDDS